MTHDQAALIERVESYLTKYPLVTADIADDTRALLTLARRGLAADKLTEVLRRIDIDNYITSGSIGPLYDAGFAFGWNKARKIAAEALVAYQSDTEGDASGDRHKAERERALTNFRNRVEGQATFWVLEHPERGYLRTFGMFPGGDLDPLGVTFTRDIHDCLVFQTQHEACSCQCTRVIDPVFLELTPVEHAFVGHTGGDAVLAASGPDQKRGTAMNEAQIKHMVERFLQWRLPDPWHPDGGISFEAEYNKGTPYVGKYEPVGTNLFDYTEAEAMVRHMLEGLPTDASGASADMPTEIWAEIVRDDDGQWAAFASTVERPTWQRFVRVDLAADSQPVEPPTEAEIDHLAAAAWGVFEGYDAESGLANWGANQGLGESPDNEKAFWRKIVRTAIGEFVKMRHHP